MITTPYLNTYHYKTELKFAVLMGKRKRRSKKNSSTTNEEEERVGLGTLGLALGIGIIGAFSVFKSKLFK